jgi:hypothetical protein
VPADTCRSRSRFGHCGRLAGHAGPHAVPIGDGLSFGYAIRQGKATAFGYGHLVGDVLCVAHPAKKETRRA